MRAGSCDAPPHIGGAVGAARTVWAESRYPEAFVSTGRWLGGPFRERPAGPVGAPRKLFSNGPSIDLPQSRVRDTSDDDNFHDSPGGTDAPCPPCSGPPHFGPPRACRR